MLAANVWHYWIAVFLAAPAVLLVVMVAAMYVKKTQAPRYPGRKHDVG
jgi:hypothetical protein